MNVKKCVNCGKDFSFNELRSDHYSDIKYMELWNDPEFRCLPCKMRKDYEDSDPERFAKEKAYEKRLDEILKIKNCYQTIKELLESKGYERFDMGFKRGVHVVIYKNYNLVNVNMNPNTYGVLRPIQMMTLKLVCALGTTTLYQVQKLISPTYMISNHHIKDALRKLVERHKLVKKKEYRDDNDNYIKSTYEIIKI